MTAVSALTVSALLATRLLSADLRGTVRDEATGEPVPGAVLTLDDLGWSTVTAADGTYVFNQVPPGPQHLSVRVLGFQSRNLHVLVPGWGSLRVDLLLRTDPIEVEALVVWSRIPIRGADEGGPDLDPTRRLSAAAIRNDPFTAEPDVLEALVGGWIANTPESGGGLNVRGGDVDEVGFLLDGIPVFSPYHSGLRSSAWNPDAVSRIEVRTDPTLAADGLAGAAVAHTVDPGDRFRTKGELSTTQLGLTLAGPLSDAIGVLVAGRFGHPGLIRPPDEPSYLRGEDHDLLAKIQARLGAGELKLLGFDNRNVVRTVSQPVDPDSSSPSGDRNRFSWRSQSVGLTWEEAPRSSGAWSLQAWLANLDAGAAWFGSDPLLTGVESEREQLGVQVSRRWDGQRGDIELGLRVLRDRVSYRPMTMTGEPGEPDVSSDAGRTAVFGRVARDLGDRTELSAGLLLGAGRQGPRILPRVGVQFRMAQAASLHAEYIRTAQPLQSLRNGESVVGRIFPSELYAGGAGLPVAESHTGVVGVVAVPWPGGRIDLQSYARSLHGLVEVAPQDGGPFASERSARGSSSVLGGAVEVSASASRFAAIAAYGVEEVRVESGSVEYVPTHGSSQRLRIGAIAFPSTTLSIRVGWIAEFGRRGTDTIGLLEWESCNLLDKGCEFAGSPEDLGKLGDRRLPSYQTLDVSVRKHWHLELAGRDARLETYATATNLLGRANTLVFVVDPSTGVSEPIEMRPRAPLTVGLGWVF